MAVLGKCKRERQASRWEDCSKKVVPAVGAVEEEVENSWSKPTISRRS